MLNHSQGDPPEDPGNNGSEVPGVGRPPCIPPQDPGHGQPPCVPPEAPPGQGGDNPGNGNGGDGGNGNDNPGNGNGGGQSMAASDGSTTMMNHSEGNPPEDPGNNATEVPGVGRPPCIPPQDPGHGQPSCIPPENPPGQGGDNPGNGGDNPGNGGDNPGNGGQSAAVVTGPSDLLSELQ